MATARHAAAALGVLGAILGAPRPARADQPVPVYVYLYGTGVVRERLAAGSTVPCDSSANVVLFDGKLRAGRVYAFVSPFPSVCEQHTYGAFRDVQWSADEVYSAYAGWWRVDVPISTSEADNE